MAAAVEALADADREVLLLRHVDNLPYDEVGVLLRIDPATARKRYGRTLVRWSGCLQTEAIQGIKG